MALAGAVEKSKECLKMFVGLARQQTEKSFVLSGARLLRADVFYIVDVDDAVSVQLAQQAGELQVQACHEEQIMTANSLDVVALQASSSICRTNYRKNLSKAQTVGTGKNKMPGSTVKTYNS